MNHPNDDELYGLFRAGSPLEPSEAEWDRVFSRIRRGVARPRVVAVRTPPRRSFLLVGAALAAAAALLAALVLPTFRSTGTGHSTEAVVEVDALPVTETEDVEILSVDAADSGALVVGQLPFRGRLVLMEPGDVALRSLERDAEGEFPDVHMQLEGESTPMIWAPLAAGSKD